MSALQRLAQPRAAIALALAMLSLWLAAPAADWRIVPWGLTGADADFYKSLAELLAGLGLAAWAISRLETPTPRALFVIAAATMLACLALEWIYWFLTDWEYRLYARQWDGLKAAPVAAVLAALMLPGLTATKGWPTPVRLRASRWLIGGGALASIALALVQHTPGINYDMLEVMGFALLAATFLTGAAMSLGGIWPFHKGPRLD